MDLKKRVQVQKADIKSGDAPDVFTVKLELVTTGFTQQDLLKLGVDLFKFLETKKVQKAKTDIGDVFKDQPLPFYNIENKQFEETEPDVSTFK